MKFNLKKTIYTFVNAVAITAVLSDAAYAVKHTCSDANETENQTLLGQTDGLFHKF